MNYLAGRKKKNLFYEIQIKYKHPLYWVDELSKQKRYLHGIRLQNFIFRNSDEMKNQIIELIERKRGYQLQMTKRKGLPITND